MVIGLGFIGSERQATKASGVPYTTRAQGDLQYFYFSPESPLFCDHCHTKLGILRILRCALFKKKGSVYAVVCPECRLPNPRVKGELKERFDDRWKDLKK